MPAGTIAGDRIRPLAGPAPTPRVSLRPPSGFAVSSPVSVPSRPGCHRQASPRREPGLWSWRHLARRWSASPVAAAYPFGGRGAAGPASAGASHRAAPHARRPPSAICGPTAAGAPRHLAEEQVNQVHSAPMSPGRRALAVILAIIGVLAIIAGILYLAGAANSLHFMVGSVHKGHHLVRAAVSFVAGVALLAGAWFAARAGPNSRP